MATEEQKVTLDANTAVGRVAHALSEVISIYPITPSSPMGEVADDLSAKNEKNIWGTVPTVVEMGTVKRGKYTLPKILEFAEKQPAALFKQAVK